MLKGYLIVYIFQLKVRQTTMTWTIMLTSMLKVKEITNALKYVKQYGNLLSAKTSRKHLMKRKKSFDEHFV